jgi:AmmeMemoRadiSam system protein B
MEETNIRTPAVCGQFYPSSANEITKLIDSFIDKKTVRSDAIACMLPHAGYIYSGRVAAQTISSVNLKDTIILLGPNHTGYGSEFSIMSRGFWQTPLGNIKIQSRLAEKILAGCAYIKEDPLAHAHEHSIEVELPLLQYFKKDFEIVPIALMSNDVKKLKSMGKNIADVIIDLKLEKSVLLAASSDMTHYESQEQAQKKDGIAIKDILRLDEDTLMKHIDEFNITMCGYAPVIAMLAAAKKLGAHTARLIKYQTSGDITGDRSAVVGYAGILIF